MSVFDILFGAMPTMLYSQFFRYPQIPQTDCLGKTIIVTGANTGLGKEAARHFVRLGASKVIIACRSVAKGEEAKRDIEATTRRTGVLEVWPLDLVDYDSVEAFATRAEGLERLDVVLENAGVNTQKFTIVAGNEMNVTVNVVGTFLLALLLIPKLRSDSRKYGFTPTLTMVTSELHAFVPFNERKEPGIFTRLNDETKSASASAMASRYPVTKLLEIFALREIAREHPVKQLGCTLNLVNPGWCHSELARELGDSGFAAAAFGVVMKIMCRTTDAGSRTLVDAAISHGTETHGQYISDQRVAKVSPLVASPEGLDVQKRVWHELSEKLEGIQPGILKNLD
ncbi:hypothetical protein LTR08_002729 [Meristemomyces frigidus]|nr:hypothetical protein LTR08_002729 [Meristemomyces frigidus]